MKCDYKNSFIMFYLTSSIYCGSLSRLWRHTWAVSSVTLLVTPKEKKGKEGGGRKRKEKKRNQLKHDSDILVQYII